MVSRGKDSGKDSGKVYIVGAGVGGIDYLTVRGQQLLLQAEVLIYDALADDRLLQLVPLPCDRINAGKRGGEASMAQADINALLVAQCLAGKQVVRLKSGDPLVFGRIVPELQALEAAGCAYELVPGISSAIAAPLFAGIPLTEAAASPCFTVLTGHDLDVLPWTALYAMPTLVVLMGTTHLDRLLNQLRQGKSDNTPIAIVQWCGRPQQRVWVGTLADIRDRLPDPPISPATIVVGEVVGKRWTPQPSLEPREHTTQELQGKTILITRAAGQSSQFADMLTARGARVLEMPTLAIVPPDSWDPLDTAIAQLQTYQWLILTSANAVEFFFARLHHAGKDSRALHGLKVAVVGRKTADALGQQGIVPDLIPQDFVADALAAEFPDPAGCSLLFPRVQSGGRDVLIEQLTQRGARVDAVPAYESGCPAAIDPVCLQALQNRRVDAITFASSKTVRHFCQLLSAVAPPTTWQGWLSGVAIASIGPQTSATCLELLGRVDREAQEYTLEGLAAAIAS